MTSDNLTILTVALPIGVSSLSFGFWQCWREFAPRHWPQVPGTVVASRIDVRRTAKGGVVYNPVVEYEYRYRDQDFRSSRRRPGNYTSGRRPAAEAVSARYPAGSTVQVFVSPDHPSKSVLEIGMTPLSWIFLVIGFVWTGLGLFSIILK